MFNDENEREENVMKKIISILLSLTMLLSLVACGGNTTPSDADNTPAS